MLGCWINNNIQVYHFEQMAWCWLTHWGSWQCYLFSDTLPHSTFMGITGRVCIISQICLLVWPQDSRAKAFPLYLFWPWGSGQHTCCQFGTRYSLLYCRANILRDTIVLAVTGCLNNMVVCCMMYCIDYVLWYQCLLDVYWFNVTLYICWVVWLMELFDTTGCTSMVEFSLLHDLLIKTGTVRTRLRDLQPWAVPDDCCWVLARWSRNFLEPEHRIIPVLSLLIKSTKLWSLGACQTNSEDDRTEITVWIWSAVCSSLSDKTNNSFLFQILKVC